MFTGTYAQELKLINIDCNPVLKKLHKEKQNFTKSISTTTDTLELPFFDDFSQAFPGYPNPEKWTNKCVFINNDYAINQPSQGVASFDAIDFTGEIYSHINYATPAKADTLTSQPINATYTPEDSLFMTFFFQAKGATGNGPEEEDSLLLQFYAPLQNTWNTVWAVNGDISTTKFYKAHLPVLDTAYLHSGFQFRFMNYVSISSNYEPAWAGNVDNWNVDYVYLDKDRSYGDTIFKDIGLTTVCEDFFENYSFIPWRHYSETDFQIKDLWMYFNNLYTEIGNVRKEYRLINKLTSDTIIYISDWDNYLVGMNSFDVIISNQISQLDSGELGETASFEHMYDLFFERDDIQFNPLFDKNDTLKITQTFSNFYAYDDGTPEAGIGITGEGSNSAMIAQKFHAHKEDTLSAIQIFFNRSKNDLNADYFYLCVWDDNNGVPGDTIYNQIGARPYFPDSLNEFCSYPIDDTTLIVSGDFYVGWTKTSNNMLNAGFDFSRDIKEKTFFNLYGEWENSIYEGNIMIRPVFGKLYDWQLKTEKIEKTHKTVLYPNPVKNILNIDVNGRAIDRVDVYSTSGQQVISNNLGNKTLINISHLPKGIYFIQLIFEDQTIENHRFIKASK